MLCRNGFFVAFRCGCIYNKYVFSFSEKETVALQKDILHKIRQASKKDIFLGLLMLATGIAITIAGIHYKQHFFRIMPLYVSLIIGFLQSRVNRYSSLMGSINSLVYGAVYFYYNLYGSALSAILFSCPIQMVTFIRWNKNKRGESTVLRKMTARQRIVLGLTFVVFLVILWLVLPLLGAEYVFLDSASTVLGIMIYFLTMFAYIEYPFFMIINGLITIALYISMLEQTPETMSHLIFAIYSFVCTVFALFEAKKLYGRQQQENTAQQA